MFTRRQYLTSLAWWACLEAGLGKGKHVPSLLVRACWQSYSMGEVAQVAGLLQLLERSLPGVKLTVWASSLAHGVGDWLAGHFPKVQCLTGTVGKDGLPDQKPLLQAWQQCDFFLHGPSTNVVARDHLLAWQKHTGKPFGLYGVTLGTMDEKLLRLLTSARFVFLRDGASRALAIRQGLLAAQVAFVPDSALAMNLRNQRKGLAWLKRHGLANTPFICVVPKLRHTPYWEIFERSPKYAEVSQAQVNAQWREADLGLVREALVAFLRLTKVSVLCMAELPYQVELGQREILEKLPEEFRSRCVVRTESCYPDEAATIFRQAKLVLSMELLSAVVAETVGTPALHLRPPTDATQGQMWRDLGLSEWLFALEKLTPSKLCDALLLLQENPDAQARTLAKTNEFIRECEAAGMRRLQTALAGG